VARKQEAVVDSTGWIIVAVVVIALGAVLALIAISARGKSKADDHARAEQLRDKAHARAGDLDSERAVAAEAERRAEEARQAAAEAEKQAAEAQTSVAQQEAIVEDQVRAADRLDPEVDHTADDYAPTVEPAAPAAEEPVAEEPVAEEAPPTEEPAAEPEPTAEEPPADEARTPLLPRRTRGAQEMPGQQLESDWGDNYFKRRSDAPE
jgi:FtsZ-interacting cell division protein ZipA